jgi:UDP-2-acetamido-3-amino-2,3-dideoxy-glucuronate N-acetyltransferase
MEPLPLSGQRVDLGNRSVAWWPCHIGKDAIVGEQVSIGALAHIGQRVILGDRCKIQGAAYIADACVLHDDVFIGPSAVLLNDKFPPSNDRKKWRPVVVEEGAVVGGGATVVPGCTIGKNSVLGAGSVLTKSIPENEVWAGNPAKRLMTRAAYEQRREVTQ